MEQAILTTKKRIDSIDILRGIIMIIMALDHTRDFFHTGAMTSDPTNPATSTPILFFTRWITHYCAPLFVFLAGTSIFLAGTKLTKKELSVYLLKRGLWLMILEITIFNLLFSFDPLYHFVGLQVIWVTGVSMVLMAAIIYLPLRALLIIGLVIVIGHIFSAVTQHRHIFGIQLCEHTLVCQRESLRRIIKFARRHVASVRRV